MKVSLDWLKDYVNIKKSPEDLAHALTMAGLEAKIPQAVDSDFVMDVEITSNRPDWLSHIGVAREVSAVFQKKLNIPLPKLKSGIQAADRTFRIAIEESDFCPYYSAVYLENVQQISTPEFMRKRLKALGLRSVNFLVDVTNYVLLETGQPLHVFDAELIKGDTVFVRPARKGEKLIAIDGKEYELISTDLVIADADGPIAIAGVMGGKNTEINAKTKNVLLESAYFDPVAVRSASRRLALVSDSSYRFERSVDPKGVNFGRDRAVQLISEHAAVQKISKVFAGGNVPISRKQIHFDLNYLKSILGVELKSKDVTSMLTFLGLGIKKKGNRFSADIPTFRPDLIEPVDIVEEVARIYGYDKIPEVLPSAIPLEKVEESIFPFLDEVRTLLTGAGFDEVVNFSLINENNLLKTRWDVSGATRIINPQNKELSIMRPTLMQGLIENVQRNLNLGNTNLSFFEVGRVYGNEIQNKLPDEIWHAGLAVTGKKLLNWMDKGREVTLYDLKGVIQMLDESLHVRDFNFLESHHPFLSDQAALQIRVGQEPVGVLGELREDLREFFDIPQKVYLAELNLEILSKRRILNKRFIPFSKFPAVHRDLALLVPKQLKAKLLLERIQSVGTDLLKYADIFDVFESSKLPSGVKSVGVTMTFQSDERTLSSEEINVLQENILSDLKEQFGASLR